LKNREERCRKKDRRGVEGQSRKETMTKRKKVKKLLCTKGVSKEKKDRKKERQQVRQKKTTRKRQSVFRQRKG